MNELQSGERVALVTGASGGMGLAISRALAAQGFRVALNDLHARDAERGTETISKLGYFGLAVPGDVTVASVADSIIRIVETQLGRLDVLVNNAGVLKATRAEAISDEEWDFVVNGNLRSAFYCCRAAIPALRRSGRGGIINISSSAGKSVSTIGGVHYTAAKAGVLGLTRHLARELAPDNIRVNAVCPGLIDTPMVRTTIPDARVDAYAASFPARRLGLPSEVADLVAFLASDRATYITGASCDINGGDLTI
jgi:3-oxoacyl-[acyl-carrier protein] reductase